MPRLRSVSEVERIEVVDPATGQQFASFSHHTDAEIDAALNAADHAQRGWANVPPVRRGRLLSAIAARLRERSDALARLITREMGKPLGESIDEIEKCARVCDFYAREGESLLAERDVTTEADVSYVALEPVGVVLAIMPWNYPFWQVLRFAAPAVMAGNAALLKHAPNVSGCAVAIEELFAGAGAPPGLLQTLLISDSRVGAVVELLLDDPRVGAVTLTGSERAGTAVASAAGRALKKSVMELGGSDPFVVLDDADVEAAAQQAVHARFANAGQACISAKRFIVARQVAEEFEEYFVTAVAALRVGDPFDPRTDVGPMARPDLVATLERQIEESVAGGARIAIGGARLPTPGYFFSPTIIADVTPDLPVFREETFGPVAAITTASDDDEAIHLANMTPYGLGVSVWTRDLDRGLRVGRRIQSGSLFVNAIVSSDPRLPFGGTKRSGYGRELAAEGLREFANVRSVWGNRCP